MSDSSPGRDLMPRLAQVEGVQAASGDGNSLLVDGRGKALDLNTEAAVGTYVLQAASRLAQLRGIENASRLTVES